MKKLLKIFTIISIMTIGHGSFAATLSDYDKCKTEVSAEIMRMWSFEKNSIPQKYKNMIESYVNETVTTAYNGNCTPGGAFECKAGQKRKDCDKCPEILGERKAKDQHLDDTINQRCGGNTKPTSLAAAGSTANNTVKVSGRILDENGEPLPFASVAAMGTTIGTTTNNNGEFTIPNFPSDAKLHVSFLGYNEQTLSPSSNMVVKMTVKNADLEPVIVEAKTQMGKPCKNKDLPENAKSGIYDLDVPGDDTISPPRSATYKCIITECKRGYEGPGDNNTCVKIEGLCTPTAPNATEGKRVFRNGAEVCVPTKCADGFVLNKEACEPISGNCPKDLLPPNATGGNRQWDAAAGAEICVVTACKEFYKLENGQCVSALTDEQRADRQKELDDNARAMKEKEQSAANRLLTSAAIGTSSQGIGQLLTAGAESRADERAEADMRALLASFHCTYGQNQQVAGGETGVYLPGANELTVAVQNYKKLALEIADMKEQLDMMPGIESQVVIDKATTGLYDDESIGRQGGAFTRLSVALSNAESADAAAWAKQKSDTADKKKTGLILTGVGVIGGVAGDMLINTANKNGNNIFGQPVAKESSRAINDKYRDMANRSGQLKAAIESAPVVPGEVSGEEAEAIIKRETNDEDVLNTELEQVTVPSTDNTVGNLQEEIAQITEEIVNNTDETDQETIRKTLCDAPGVTCNADGNVVLNGVNFEFNKATITSTAEPILKTVATSIKEIQGNQELSHLNFSIKVYGHTDSAGSDAVNNRLSLQRAEAVKAKLVENGVNPENIILPEGKGKSSPIASNNTSAGRAENRRVEIQVLGMDKV